MPLIKVERIVSFSSEDPIHAANNILLKDTSKKWKCKILGEIKASVVLQLDQPYTISGIDIGNQHSAYIEVLVSRSSLPGDYKVLLVMSSFMTPLEARQSQNVNKVRMFKQEDFSEPEKNEKWDRVMIVCTQPFNRHVQYGLSFINLYTNDKSLEDPSHLLIGKYTLRPESPDNISSGSLFARRKELQEAPFEQTLKGAAAIREATSLSHIAPPALKHKLKNNSPLTPNFKCTDLTDKAKSPKPRNRNEILYTKDEEEEQRDKFSKFENKLSEKREDDKHNTQRDSVPKGNKVYCEDKQKTKPDKKVTISTKTKKDEKKQNEVNKHNHSGEFKHNLKVHNKKVVGKPFARLLEDVVFVISGIQNPERASLRSMALSMGAKYKGDWDNTCTHLICAFANTPKFNQVKGRGKIVKKSWLDDCYNKKKRLPWRRYALDDADKGIESEEEICKDELCNEHSENHNLSPNSDVEMGEEGSDTEDQIEQIKKRQKHIPLFERDTDNEFLTNDCKALKIQQTLKNFFSDKLFYVDEGLEAQTTKKIKQYIVAYKGILTDSIQAGTNIITKKSNYNNLKEVHSEATYIASDWVWECHNCQKLIPMDNYVFYK